ncbi:MAG: hypothetical protein OHK0011_27480 [Turneriella sp.]
MRQLTYLVFVSTIASAVDFPHTTRRFIEINAPIGPEGRKGNFIDARLPTFSTVVRLTGRKKALTNAQTEMLQKLGPMQKRLAPLSSARDAVELADARGNFWVIADAKTQLPDLSAAGPYLAELTYVGCCLLGDKDNTYILNRLAADSLPEPANDLAVCRIDNFHGFNPGGSVAKALAHARRKYKIVKNLPQDLGKMIYVVLIDEEKKIFAYLTTGGADQPDYLHAVQFSVYTPVQFPISRQFQFGMTYKELNKAFEFQLGPPETNGEYALSRHISASCSFEFSPDGNLFSVRYYTYE